MAEKKETIEKAIPNYDEELKKLIAELDDQDREDLAKFKRDQEEAARAMNEKMANEAIKLQRELDQQLKDLADL